MEIRINLVILGLFAVIWAGLSQGAPASALDPSAAETRELARMEDAFAATPQNPAVAQRLAEAYLEADQPGLVIAALFSAGSDVREHPMVAHRLSQAYERSGSMLDAWRIAELAANRCARHLGYREASTVTPVPKFRCAANEYATLDLHRTALEKVVDWGVASPEDPRLAEAYRRSVRRVAILMP